MTSSSLLPRHRQRNGPSSAAGVGRSAARDGAAGSSARARPGSQRGHGAQLAPSARAGVESDRRSVGHGAVGRPAALLRNMIAEPPANRVVRSASGEATVSERNAHPVLDSRDRSRHEPDLDALARGASRSRRRHRRDRRTRRPSRLMESRRRADSAYTRRRDRSSSRRRISILGRQRRHRRHQVRPRPPPQARRASHRPPDQPRSHAFATTREPAMTPGVRNTEPSRSSKSCPTT